MAAGQARARGDSRGRGDQGGRVTEACQTLADLVRGRRIIHPGDPLLNEHKAGATQVRWLVRALLI